MDCFEVTGGTPLRGRVRVTGAKNSALKLMAAALLATGRTTLDAQRRSWREFVDAITSITGLRHA